MKKYLILCVLIGIISCKKDIPPEQSEQNLVLNESGNVLVLNEGNFMFGNAKVTYYDITNASVITDLYEQTNGTTIGDVLQSAKLFNNKIYFVVNNSGKIVVCDPLNLQAVSTISGFTSPRYFIPLSNNKAYVSDLYANKIWIVDLANNTISGNIPLNGWCEQMTEIYGKVYVTNYEKGKVYIINSMTDMITDSITITYGASGIVEDKNANLWVLCNGDVSSSVTAQLYRINPITDNIDFSTIISNSPSRLIINPTGDVLYYLNNGVYSFAINNSTENATALIPGAGYNFYGLGINPGDGNLYVSDAIDYIQYGKIYIYSQTGVYKSQFNAGIIPSDFLFR